MSETNGKARLFEYAVILHPEKDDDGEDIGSAKLIVEVDRVLAHDENEVAIRAARALPDDVMDDLKRVDIAIRPF